MDAYLPLLASVMRGNWLPMELAMNEPEAPASREEGTGRFLDSRLTAEVPIL